MSVSERRIELIMTVATPLSPDLTVDDMATFLVERIFFTPPEQAQVLINWVKLDLSEGVSVLLNFFSYQNQEKLKEILIPCPGVSAIIRWLNPKDLKDFYAIIAKHPNAFIIIIGDPAKGPNSPEEEAGIEPPTTPDGK